MQIKRGHLYVVDFNPRVRTKPGKLRPALVMQSNLVNEAGPHYSRRLLLQPPIRRYDKPDGGRARRSVGQHTVSSMLPSLTAPRARLAWRLGGFVTSPRA